MSEKDNLQDADGNELENAVAQENTQRAYLLAKQIEESNKNALFSFAFSVLSVVKGKSLVDSILNKL